MNQKILTHKSRGTRDWGTGGPVNLGSSNLLSSTSTWTRTSAYPYHFKGLSP